ncbi:MAG: GspMb/PilO family protein [Pseudomonadota bacterium]
MSEFHFERPTDTRLALAAFVTTVALGLGALGVEAVSAIKALEADIDEKRVVLARGKLAETASTPIAAYSARTAEEARARFQTDLQTLADKHGLAIETLDSADLVLVNGMVRIGVTVSGSIAENELAELLIALDSARPAVLVEGISLRRGRGQRTAKTPRLLPIRLEIVAYADA